MTTASLIVDFHFVRCNGCKVSVDELAEQCPICGAAFDRITSNHVGLAAKLQKKREEAGIKLAVPAAVGEPGASGSESAAPSSNGSPAGESANTKPAELTAAIVVDFHNLRCGHCKCHFEDELAERCPICDARFDRVTSNHVGLAGRVQAKRQAEAAQAGA